MLGPFRVRGVGSPVHPGSPVHLRRPRFVDRVVSIDGDRYERLIQNVPSAKLQYLDTDADVITIGSQQELADRLAEPVSRDELLLRFAARGAMPSISLHSFSFPPNQEALLEWKQIEAEQTAKPAQEIAEQRLESAQEQSILPTAPALPPKVPQSPEPISSSAKGKEPETRPIRPVAPLQIKEEKRSPPLASSNPSDLSNLREMHFQRTQPPSTSATQGESSNSRILPPNARPSDWTPQKELGVLTAQGMEQAREEGERLRARLGQSSVPLSFYASTTSRPDNRWASYSNTSALAGTSTVQLSGGSHTVEQADAATDTKVTEPSTESVTIDLRSAPAYVDQQRIEAPESSIDSATEQRGALDPVDYQMLQSRLAKLANSSEPSAVSPVLDHKVETGLTAAAPKEQIETTEESPSYLRSSPTNVPAVDLREPLEIMVGKMIAQSIESVSSEFASLGGRLKELVLPKLPEEAFKLKGYPDPEQLKEMWRDLEETKRALQTFGPDVDFAARIVRETDGEGMFPHGSGMVDRKAIRAYSLALKKMAGAVGQLIDNVLKDAVPVEGSEASKQHPAANYVIPKRLTACNYEDMWSITLGNLDRDASEDHVRYLVWRARGSVGLSATTCKIGTVSMSRYVSGCQAEVEICGKQQASETFNAMLMAESDPSHPQPLHLKRKLYPKVYRFPENENGAAQAVQPAMSEVRTSSNSSINLAATEAKLKSIQDRRAAWRREYKARASSVRFKEPVVEAAEPKEGNTLLDSPIPSLHIAPSLMPSSPALKMEATEVNRTQNTPQRENIGDVSTKADTPKPILKPAVSMASMPRLTFFPPTEVRQKRSLPAMRPSPDCMRQEYDFRPVNRVGVQLRDPQAPQPAVQEVSRNIAPEVPVSQPTAYQALPGAWPVERPTRESSGAFARRMMGRSPSASNLISPQTSPLLKPARSTWPRPVSAIDFLSGSSSSHQPATIISATSNTQLEPGAIDPATKSASGPWSRRPYSVTFDGSGRVENDRSRNAGTRNARRQARIHSQPIVAPPPATEAAAETSRLPTVPRRSSDIISAEEAQIKNCVDSLIEMGFGSNTDPERATRLWMYARTAKGQLEEAIDMIEEEREAWQEQGFF